MINALRSQLSTAVTFRGAFDLKHMARTAAELPVRYLLTDGLAGEPLAVNVLITLRCNLRCHMCDYMDVLTKERRHELTAQEIGDLASTFSGRPSFFFSGGEPFVRKDLIDCMRAVKDRGLKVGTITNGLLLTPERIEELAALDIETIIFSLHGDAQHHDAVVGKRGAHSTLVANIREFCRRRKNTQVLINCAVNERNVRHLDEVVKTGLAVGADHIRMEHLVHMTPTELEAHRQDAEVDQRGYSRTELDVNTYVHGLEDASDFRQAVLEQMSELRAKYPNRTVFKPHLDPTEVERWYREDGGVQGRSCLFVWTSVFIDPWGNVTPCQFYPKLIMGNIREQPLGDIYNADGFRRFRRELRKGLFGGCRRCCKL